MHSFWKGVERGRFDQLNNRDNLWPLLVVITIRKSIDVIQKENRRRPTAGRVHGDSLFAGNAGDTATGLDQFLANGPTEHTVNGLNEECRRLLAMLANDTLRRVATLKLEGFHKEEIAQQIGYSTSTVARMLQLIRKTWAEELPT